MAKSTVGTDAHWQLPNGMLKQKLIWLKNLFFWLLEGIKKLFHWKIEKLLKNESLDFIVCLSFFTLHNNLRKYTLIFIFYLFCFAGSTILANIQIKRVERVKFVEFSYGENEFEFVAKTASTALNFICQAK